MLGFLSRINLPYKEDDVSCVFSELEQRQLSWTSQTDLPLHWLAR